MMMAMMMMTFSQVEMDSIVDQMMSVAEMLGWETNELRPVFLMMNLVRMVMVMMLIVRMVMVMMLIVRMMMVMMIMMFGMCCQNTI